MRNHRCIRQQVSQQRPLAWRQALLRVSLSQVLLKVPPALLVRQPHCHCL